MVIVLAVIVMGDKGRLVLWVVQRLWIECKFVVWVWVRNTKCGAFAWLVVGAAKLEVDHLNFIIVAVAWLLLL